MEIILTREVEMESFCQKSHKKLVEAMRKFIKREDLCDEDIIGVSIVYADSSWYGTLTYAGEPIDVDKGEDNLEEEVARSKRAFNMNQSAILNKPN